MTGNTWSLVLLLKTLLFSALCYSDMTWAEPGPGCLFMSPLENIWRSVIICFLASRTLPGWGHTWPPGWCLSDGIIQLLFLSSPHGPLQLKSPLLKTLIFKLKNRLPRRQLSLGIPSLPGAGKWAALIQSPLSTKKRQVFEFLYLFLKLDRREGHRASNDMHSNSRKVTFTHVTLRDFLNIPGCLFLWRSHRIYTSGTWKWWSHAIVRQIRITHNSTFHHLTYSMFDLFLFLFYPHIFPISPTSQLECKTQEGWDLGTLLMTVSPELRKRPGTDWPLDKYLLNEFMITPLGNYQCNL